MMYECDYSREPMDIKLLLLRLLKKWWLIIVSAFCGAVLVCGTYYFVKTVVMGRTYQVQNIYYIDFAEDSSGAQYTWVNQYTWSELADMNVFIEDIYNKLNGAVSMDELRKSSDCTVESDGRYLYMRITTHDPALSKEIADAYEETLFNFCDYHKEFNSIICEHEGEAKENSNLRITEMLIVGALAGLFVFFILWLFLAATDTSIHIPATIEKRYHVPTLTAPSMKEFESNVEFFAGNSKSVAVVNVDKDITGAGIAIHHKEYGNPCENTEALDEIAGTETVFVNVKAGAHNGKMLERVLEQLGRRNIKVTAVMLTCEDEMLLKRYYRS